MTWKYPMLLAFFQVHGKHTTNVTNNICDCVQVCVCVNVYLCSRPSSVDRAFLSLESDYVGSLRAVEKETLPTSNAKAVVI